MQLEYVALPSRYSQDGGIEVRCEGVVHLYRTFAGHDVVALRGVDLSIAPGERVAFVGPSGCGKSTLLTLLGGIQRPSAGQVYLDGHEISRMSERRLTVLRSELVGTMLQGAGRNLLGYATAKQNLAFARVALPAVKRRELPSAREALDLVGLADQADQVVSTMSGGQQQRLALACAVATMPRLLLADEPTSALGHEDRDVMVRLLHRIGERFGTTIVVVTHAPEVADSFARTVVMRDGRVGSEGRAGEEYVVMGEDADLRLPAGLASLWPAGTLVRVETDGDDRLIVRRAQGAGDKS